MECRCKDEADACVLEALLQLRWPQLETHAGALKHVGGANPSADRAIPMFGAWNAGRRGNQRRPGGYINRTRAVAAGPRGIQHSPLIEIEPPRPRAQHSRPARQLCGALALYPHRDEQPSHARFRCDIVDDLAEHRFGLGQIERASGQHLLESLPRDAHRAIPSTKFWSRCLPSGVPIDSGWNCTPSIAYW